MLDIIFAKQAQKDYNYFAKTNPALKSRIDKLVESIQHTPFEGLGKPEPLKFDFQSYWSRRIDHEHRLVYKIFEDTLYIAQCRYHY